MKKTLLVSGCSITHGAELVDGFMHPDNVQGSYSSHLAKWLNVDLVNVALSGASNEYIFHSILSQLDKIDNRSIHSVIVAWASVHRLYWNNKGRHWFFLPTWASSMSDVYDWSVNQHPSKDVMITSDRKDLLPCLHQQHEFFVENYLDDDQYLFEQVSHYSKSLQAITSQMGLYLIELNVMANKRSPGYVFNRGSLGINGRHPNRQEHREIAQEIFDKFYSAAHKKSD